MSTENKESAAASITGSKTRYPVSDEVRADIEARWGAKIMTASQAERINAIRYAAKNLGYLLNQTIKPGQELRMALYCLDESTARAEAGIIRLG